MTRQHKVNYQSLFINNEGTKDQFVIICQCGGNGRIDKDNPNGLVFKCSNCTKEAYVD